MIPANPQPTRKELLTGKVDSAHRAAELAGYSENAGKFHTTDAPNEVIDPANDDYRLYVTPDGGLRPLGRGRVPTARSSPSSPTGKRRHLIDTRRAAPSGNQSGPRCHDAAGGMESLAGGACALGEVGWTF